MKKILGLCLIVGLVGCSSKYDSCIEKGINYYKEVGSYPRLESEDISADAKVKQLCNSNKSAFD